MTQHNLTRREFLRASLASAATLLIAGCQPVTDGASRINPAPSADESAAAEPPPGTGSRADKRSRYS